MLRGRGGEAVAAAIAAGAMLPAAAGHAARSGSALTAMSGLPAVVTLHPVNLLLGFVLFNCQKNNREV